MLQDMEHSRLSKLNDDQLMALRRSVDEVLTGRGCSSGGDGLSGMVPACRLFTVSEGVRRLDKRQLESLSASFEAWAEASRDARTRRSRERVLMVYLVLRYTGARLGEVLALDEHKDLDLERSVVLFPTSSGDVREAPLPPEVADRIAAWVERQEGLRQSGEEAERLFIMDQGFLRRKFYEQEERSGLSRDLLNPRVLRNSRAIELLQGGMPMRAVQALLGHSKADFTASYVTLTDTDLKNIIWQHCSKEFGMTTSARNTFRGAVVSVTSNTVMSEVVLRTDSGYEVAAVITNQSRDNLSLEVGRQATAIIKATWAVLEKADSEGAIGRANRFPVTVTGVNKNDVVAEIRGDLGDGSPVCALISADSCNRLEISEGDSFLFSFKAMSVIVC